MGLSRPYSLNDEGHEMPKLRKDQWRKCSQIAKQNSHEIAVGLIRDLLKGNGEVQRCSFNADERQIELFLYNPVSKMSMTYCFSTVRPVSVETPTLD